MQIDIELAGPKRLHKNLDGTNPETVAWVTTARVISAFAVVLLHSVAHSANAGPSQGQTAWLLAVALDASVRWCVPVFVMLSGFLLLAPSRSSESALYFYRRRASKIFVPTITWTVIYIVFMWVKSRHDTPPYTLSDAFLSIYRGIPFYHMWYMFTIACLYGVTPLLRRICALLTERQFVIFAVFCLSAAIVVAGVSGETQDNVQSFFLFVFPYYVGYFLIGRVIGDKIIHFPMPIVVAAGAIIGSAVLVATTENMYFFEYLGVTVVPMSLAVFSLLCRLRVTVLDWISEYTLGIYLVHPVFIMAMKVFLDRFPGTPAIVGFGFKTTFGFFASLLFVWILRRIKYLQRIV